MGRQLVGDPSQVGDRGVGEDRGRARVRCGEAQRVGAKRLDPAAGVDQDRQAVLVGEREDGFHSGVREREALGAGVQLDSADARRDRARAFGARVVMRIEPAEGHDPVVRSLGHLEDEIVVARVAAVGAQREGHCPGAECLQRLGELRRLAGHAVVAVGPKVGVRVDDRQAGEIVQQRREPAIELGLGCAGAAHRSCGIGRCVTAPAASAAPTARHSQPVSSVPARRIAAASTCRCRADPRSAS